MVEITQKMSSEKIENLESSIRGELERVEIARKIKPNSRIAITVGSRDITNIDQIIATIVEETKKYGALPFIIPAMGSHGGATPQGQQEILKSLGVTEKTVKAPIISSLEVDEVGKIHDNYPVYVSKDALNADGIILVNRIKPHTDFKGAIESGLIKITVIGLGKQKGAETLHTYGMEGYRHYLPKVAQYIFKHAPILFGVAIIENAYHELAKIRALLPEEIEGEERRLLEKAKQLIPKIPFKDVDVLIIDQIGKDISGNGMDPNVTGRFIIPSDRPSYTPNIKILVALDLTEKSEGNVTGIGFADLTTRRLFEKIDFEKTFVNAITVGYPLDSRIPVFLPSDMAAIETALKLLHPPIDAKHVKVVRIKNTRDLEHMWVSEALIEEVKANKKLQNTITIRREPNDLMFDVLGSITR